MSESVMTLDEEFVCGECFRAPEEGLDFCDQSGEAAIVHGWTRTEFGSLCDKCFDSRAALEMRELEAGVENSNGVANVGEALFVMAAAPDAPSDFRRKLLANRDADVVLDVFLAQPESEEENHGD